MRGRIHHLDLTVSDPNLSRPLYELFLTHMGYREVDRKENGGTEWDLPGDSFMSVGIAKAKGPNAHHGHDRYSPGLHHAAWVSPTREDVDALFAKLQTFGATILDPPKDYPEYNGGRGYYAVFFADRDGLKLEYVWTPKSPA
jgi:catechol 2,3-dioxygenase-like lactoylglutathione lyase family enzyme